MIDDLPKPAAWALLSGSIVRQLAERKRHIGNGGRTSTTSGPDATKPRVQSAGNLRGSICPCATTSAKRVLRSAWTGTPSDGEPAIPRAPKVSKRTARRKV